MKSFSVGSVLFSDDAPLVLIAGPCVVENHDITFQTAGKIKQLSIKHNIPVIFKASYKKANRTNLSTFSTIGIDEALTILADVKREFSLPILTDVHSEIEAGIAAAVADVLQIPAFLCRQTELLQAAGETGRAINIKKGQFLAPEEMRHAAQKILATGNGKILLTERGTSFGYHNLVVDMRGLVIMKKIGFPIVLDATHSVQLPGGEVDRSGGQPEFILPLARAGVAVGVNAVFIETHPDPPNALSDAASQLPLEKLETLIIQIKSIDDIRRTFTE